MNEIDGVLCLTCDSHHCVMHASTLQISLSANLSERLRDLPKVAKQKVAELEQLHPLPPLLYLSFPLQSHSHFHTHNSVPLQVPCASHQSPQPSSKLCGIYSSLPPCLGA